MVSAARVDDLLRRVAAPLVYTFRDWARAPRIAASPHPSPDASLPHPPPYKYVSCSSHEKTPSALGCTLLLSTPMTKPPSRYMFPPNPSVNSPLMPCHLVGISGCVGIFFP